MKMVKEEKDSMMGLNSDGDAACERWRWVRLWVIKGRPCGASVGWPPGTALLMWQQLVNGMWPEINREEVEAGFHQTAGCEFRTIPSDRDHS